MGMDIISPIDYKRTDILKIDFSNLGCMNRLISPLSANLSNEHAMTLNKIYLAINVGCSTNRRHSFRNS